MPRPSPRRPSHLKRNTKRSKRSMEPPFITNPNVRILKGNLKGSRGKILKAEGRFYLVEFGEPPNTQRVRINRRNVESIEE